MLNDVERALDDAFKDAEACDFPASVLTDEQAENVRDALAAMHDTTPLVGPMLGRLFRSMPDWSDPQLPRLLAYHDALKEAREIAEGELRQYVQGACPAERLEVMRDTCPPWLSFQEWRERCGFCSRLCLPS